MQLRRESDLSYSEMLFFDDNKRSVDLVAKNCPGVVTVHTPNVSQENSHLFCTLSMLFVFCSVLAEKNIIF